MIFRPVTDDEWAAMPWHARQEWLNAATALRRRLLEEFDAEYCTAALGGIQQTLGEARLWEATREAADYDRRKGAADPKRRRLPAEVAEDVEWLLEQHPYITTRALAQRLGYADNSGVQVALERAGRRDLLARLARNAETAGAA